MKKIAKVGNLTIYREFESYSDSLLWLDSGPTPTVTLYAYNGADEIGHETFLTGNEAAALDVFMHSFDCYTLSDIRAGLVEVISEYDGALLSGKIAGFSTTEYFKRIDETRFYKHFTHRSAMTAEELPAR